MKVTEIVERALQDEAFAKELQVTATRAADGGVNSPEWERLMVHFSATPQELALLRSDNNPVAIEWTYTTTLTTTTSAACTTTTTTTTTGQCPNPFGRFKELLEEIHIQPSLKERMKEVIKESTNLPSRIEPTNFARLLEIEGVGTRLGGLGRGVSRPSDIRDIITRPGGITRPGDFDSRSTRR